MVHSVNDNNPLSGVTVLVVEDDLFLAMALEDTLVGMGAVVLDVCHTLDQAMAWADADDFEVLILVSGQIRSRRLRVVWRAEACPSFSIPGCRAANRA
jgi:DNA-binding response OmpR family regulator